MVAAIFRAKKKKQEEERVTDGKKEDVDQNESQKKLDKTELCKMKSTGRGRGTKKFLGFFLRGCQAPMESSVMSTNPPNQLNGTDTQKTQVGRQDRILSHTDALTKTLTNSCKENNELFLLPRETEIERERERERKRERRKRERHKIKLL